MNANWQRCAGSAEARAARRHQHHLAHWPVRGGVAQRAQRLQRFHDPLYGQHHSVPPARLNGPEQCYWRALLRAPRGGGLSLRWSMDLSRDNALDSLSLLSCQPTFTVLPASPSHRPCQPGFVAAHSSCDRPAARSRFNSPDATPVTPQVYPPPERPLPISFTAPSPRSSCRRSNIPKPSLIPCARISLRRSDSPT